MAFEWTHQHHLVDKCYLQLFNEFTPLKWQKLTQNVSCNVLKSTAMFRSLRYFETAYRMLPLQQQFNKLQASEKEWDRKQNSWWNRNDMGNEVRLTICVHLKGLESVSGKPTQIPYVCYLQDWQEIAMWLWVTCRCGVCHCCHLLLWKRTSQRIVLQMIDVTTAHTLAHNFVTQLLNAQYVDYNVSLRSNDTKKHTHTHRALEHFKLSYDCNITRFIVSSRIPSIYTGCKYRRNRSSAVYLHVNSPCLPWIESWWKTNKWHDSVTITFSIDGIHTLSSAMYTHNRVNCEWCALFWFRVAKHSYSWTWMNVTSATWQTQKSIRLNFLLNVGSKQLRWHSFCSCSIFLFR